jgi:hypothetical protein
LALAHVHARVPWRLLWWLDTVATMAPVVDAFTMRGKREKRRKGGAP